MKKILIFLGLFLLPLWVFSGEKIGLIALNQGGGVLLSGFLNDLSLAFEKPSFFVIEDPDFPEQKMELQELKKILKEKYDLTGLSSFFFLKKEGSVYQIFFLDLQSDTEKTLLIQENEILLRCISFEAVQKIYNIDLYEKSWKKKILLPGLFNTSLIEKYDFLMQLFPASLALNLEKEKKAVPERSSLISRSKKWEIFSEIMQENEIDLFLEGSFEVIDQEIVFHFRLLNQKQEEIKSFDEKILKQENSTELDFYISIEKTAESVKEKMKNELFPTIPEIPISQYTKLKIISNTKEKIVIQEKPVIRTKTIVQEKWLEKIYEKSLFIGSNFVLPKKSSLPEMGEFSSSAGLLLSAEYFILKDLGILFRFNALLNRKADLLYNHHAYAVLENRKNLDFLSGLDYYFFNSELIRIGIELNGGLNVAAFQFKGSDSSEKYYSGYKFQGGLFFETSILPLRLEVFWEYGQTERLLHNGLTMALLVKALEF